jgi:hypothetical protein
MDFSNQAWTRLSQSPLLAQGVDLSEQMQLKGGDTVASTYETPADIVNLIVSNLFVVAGIVIFGLIIGAGYSFLQNSGKGKEEARNLATGAIVGFIIMFSAYWIVQIIELVTGADIPL